METWGDGRYGGGKSCRGAVEARGSGHSLMIIPIPLPVEQPEGPAHGLCVASGTQLPVSSAGESNFHSS